MERPDDLTVAQVREHRKTCEAEIRDALWRFSANTGLAAQVTVERIDVTPMGEPKEWLYNATIRAVLP